MRNMLYAANLPPDMTEEQIRALFGEHGAVQAVEFGVVERTGMRYALLTMESEKAASKANRDLNGHDLAGQHLSISYPDVDLTRDMTSRQRKAAQAISEQLGETEEKPLRMIAAIVRLCGESFAQAILDEAEQVETAGGLMTSDGTQRRSKGGVFFYLARHRMNHPIRAVVYNRKGRMPVPVEAVVPVEEEASPAESALDKPADE